MAVRIKRKLLYQELLFQFVLISIVFLFYSFDKEDPLIEFHEAVFFLNYLLAALIIGYVLLPRYIYKKKYTAFIIYFCLLIGVVIFIEEGVLERIFFRDTKGRNFSDLIYNLLDVMPPVIILSGFKLAWDAAVKQRELDELKIIAKESELQFLKSQINPHFLFNNINNLYSYAIENSPKTPDFILSLSSILRYMLYECKAKYVPLSKELEHLEDFIALHEIQIEGRGTVEYSSKNLSSDYQIAPLILFVFVENAFKHSASSQTKSIAITIDVSVDEAGKLNFMFRNNYQYQSNLESLTHGIGLENVKKRLRLIYPNLHELKITQNNNLYEVMLTIDLNKAA